MKFAVIGLGSFGFHVAKTLFKKGNEVLTIDKSKEKIEEIKTFVSHAIIMDTTSKENLQALELLDMDVIIVSSGPELESSILTVLFLKEIGVKWIVAKALTEDHAKILDAVGAHEVFYPEKDMAIKIAYKLSSPNLLEFFPLTSGISIEEIAPPEKFIGKSLKKLDLINKYDIQIIAIKEVISDKTIFIPKADFIIKDSDILIIMGKEKQLAMIEAL
ncbi:potassium channel family protein [Acidobacteriota bacterium]